MSSTNALPTPFSSQWRAGHWQASDYASLAPAQRLARLNDVLDKAHDHHVAENANDQRMLDELRTKMNAPPYVSAAWVREQLAAAPLPRKKKKNRKKSKKEKKGKKEDFSAVAPSLLPEKGAPAGPSSQTAPVATPAEGGAGLETAAEKFGSSKLASQKALPPPSPDETNFLREDLISDTARAVTGLAHDNEFPISHRAGDGVPVALVNIPQGSTIYQEHAWITLPFPLNPTVILCQYDALSAQEQILYDSLGHNVSSECMKRQFPTLMSTHPSALDPDTKEHAIIATWLTHQDPGVHIPNAPTSYHQDSRIYPHLLEHARHSCSPNCHLFHDERYNALVLRSARAIPRGEPITYCLIADYPLFTHEARAIKLQEQTGYSTCKCNLCCSILPAPAASDSTTKTSTKGKSKSKSGKAKDTATSTNPDAIPLMKRITIETRRQQAAHAWSAWCALREPFWSASPSSPTHPDDHLHAVAPGGEDRPSARTIDALASRLDALLVDNDNGGVAVSPMQAWLRSDASHAFEDVGDDASALRWAEMELEAGALLLGPGHEGCRVAQMRIAQVAEGQVARTLRMVVGEIDRMGAAADEEEAREGSGL
ncbi:hypothetical protein SLS55_004832 [Diplodia seriata]|uniref:SET domain-containing protein n=1 Tax=Diplodia seriata TaxID=420778 RepID=A0ABR3CLH7_9PEZI